MEWWRKEVEMIDPIGLVDFFGSELRLPSKSTVHTQKPKDGVHRQKIGMARGSLALKLRAVGLSGCLAVRLCIWLSLADGLSPEMHEFGAVCCQTAAPCCSTGSHTALPPWISNHS